ncbi:NAD(P)/FAD-dependent oxidoreductase [Simiduia sp. 21SJ11W-1]|uniref:NAD(P)/FAD-dependent oxidoreductase n=1 Tax=Simiduia sp. 21SJ11W-1 TaxID=2909669 RepID=UPI00209DEB27|nr:NAD(P)/FAD-dependent oxidoreductase [Simiduia sp. 21SJ11W-1]UTA46689.1 NAD(P)/FAD-dependent oxidoreductase [Simiduia sp. 21SJ11W-1]
MHIVIVGGGAGGLELATRLGRKLGRPERANITLVDKNATHIWKPLLHEVATGVLDAGIDAVSYRAHARRHGFQFQQGAMADVNRQARTITLAAINDDRGREVVGERTIEYDYLVLALGSSTNDFGTPGVAEHCIFLDAPAQAERFHQRMLNGFVRLDASRDASLLRIAIVGAGATGVELSAELHNAAQWLSAYGLPNISRERLQVCLVEAGPRILPALPERLSGKAHRELVKLGVNVRVATRVAAAEAEGLRTSEGELLEADLMVWAAGIKAPDFLANIAGLETNRINQLVVKPTLQTTEDFRIFAMGDCAACTMADGKNVPPRAQSAHQMASCVYDNLLAIMASRPLKAFVYKDHGSLVSLSRYSTVGSLMGNLTRGSMMIEGRLARLMYISLYRMHQIALHGWLRTGLLSLSEKIGRVVRPRLKLH